MMKITMKLETEKFKYEYLRELNGIYHNGETN